MKGSVGTSCQLHRLRPPASKPMSPRRAKSIIKSKDQKISKLEKRVRGQSWFIIEQKRALIRLLARDLGKANIQPNDRELIHVLGEIHSWSFDPMVDREDILQTLLDNGLEDLVGPYRLLFKKTKRNTSTNPRGSK